MKFKNQNSLIFKSVYLTNMRQVAKLNSVLKQTPDIQNGNSLFSFTHLFRVFCQYRDGLMHTTFLRETDS